MHTAFILRPRDDNHEPSPFRVLTRHTGLAADLADDALPSLVFSCLEETLVLPAAATHFGFVEHAGASLVCDAGRFDLRAGMYFCVPGRAILVARGSAVVMSRLAYDGLFVVGGPIESRGRLRYMDGCTDTLLLPPVVRGDPCLNLLCIPPATRQQRHTHPSLRAGVIVSGRGQCVTRTGATRLTPGLAFVIPAHAEHCFVTDDEPLVVIAWHPDSDTGPVDDDHPMINRTQVVSS